MTGSAFEFSAEFSIDEIERFLVCADNTPIVVWSLQRIGAVDRLRQSGCLTGNPHYTSADGKPRNRAAYEWMRQMMAKRISGYQHEWPIWCFLSRPRSTNINGTKLLRFEIPKSRMLISFYLPWESLLRILAYLEEQNMQWQNPWFHSGCESPNFNPVRDQASDEHMPAPIPTIFDERECRSSWEQIFDLTLARRAGFAWEWETNTLQATVPVVYLPDLTEALPPPPLTEY